MTYEIWPDCFFSSKVVVFASNLPQNCLNPNQKW
jgi:hypothetical protein